MPRNIIRRSPGRGRTVAVLIAVLLLVGCPTPPPELDATARSLLWEVQQALDREAYAAAVSLLDSLAYTGHPQVHYLRGKALSTLYRFDQAEDAFETALALHPGYRGVAYQLGSNAFYLGRNRAALRHYGREEAALGRPRTRQDSAAMGAVLRQVGRVYARIGAADSAEAAYWQSLSVDANNGLGWAWLAELFGGDGKYAEALASAYRALALVPSNPEYRLLAGGAELAYGSTGRSGGTPEGSSCANAVGGGSTLQPGSLPAVDGP